ncbi:MAG: TfoX/Sxy family protein [Chloroflexi bacterium]|nr:TfoX/Sxy family protein [Chloroflexota bacterium]
MMTDPTKKDFQEKLGLYDKLLATHPDIERKGKNMLYTSVNGYMFTYFSKEGELGIRLPKDEQEAFVAQYNTPPFVQYNAVMRGYVTVPDGLLQDTDALKPYLDLSYAYVQGLKPKPTKKKKKK